jgi:hypothetical protein
MGFGNWGYIDLAYLVQLSVALFGRLDTVFLRI